MSFGDDPESVADLKIPVLPTGTNWAKNDSIVTVAFAVDDSGDVVEAIALTGDEILKKPSERAALDSKFTPPVLDGEKMPMNGRIAYKFIERDNVEITLEEIRIVMTPEKRRRLTKKYKLHFWVFALVDRLDKGIEEPSEYESRFVSNGIADVRVMLKTGTTEALKQLEKAGLKIYKTRGNLAFGKIKIEKLYDLAELEVVKYVTP